MTVPVGAVHTVAPVVALRLGEAGLGLDDRDLLPLLTYGVAATTVLSGGAYIVRWLRGAAGVSGT